MILKSAARLAWLSPSRLLGILSYLALAAPSASSHLIDETDTFDYLIVGGGTSGLVVANRLSENAGGTEILFRS